MSKESTTTPCTTKDNCLKFIAEYDEDGVMFYQAFREEIADFAVANQKFGGPLFCSTRMTWIKPSFAWVLYRSGYASKHRQTRILKVKLTHSVAAELLAECDLGHGNGGTLGRIQWDPARDLFSSEGTKNKIVPRKMVKSRAIQIGLKGRLSQKYVDNIISIVDVTELALAVGEAHRSSDVTGGMQNLIPRLPNEREYIPHTSKRELERLGLLPGETASQHARIGKGKVDVV